MAMTTPLWCLLPAVMLPYVWAGVSAPYRKQQLGVLDNKEPRKHIPKLTGKAARAYAAHLNAFEALAIFAPAVVTAHLAGADPVWSARLAIAWVVARSAHGVAYIADTDKLRSSLFFVAFASVVGLFVLAGMAR